MIGAAFGPAVVGELEYARRLAADLRAGMLLLATGTSPPPHC
ncbi:hypothetical protein [Streptomyces sp. SPB074]|nr:hypothetical protein [Streptomyces sp. SPB074]